MNLAIFMVQLHHPLATAHSKVAEREQEKQQNGNELSVCGDESATAKLQGQGTSIVLQSLVCIEQHFYLSSVSLS